MPELKLSSTRPATTEDRMQASIELLESVEDVILALRDICPTTAELQDTVNAARQVPGVLRMVMDKVAASRPR